MMTVVRIVALLLAVGVASQSSTRPAHTADIAIEASSIDGPISPLLYGQFLEFMFEGIKGGLHAELLRNRGFEEEGGANGLPRFWERYPDDRIDDYSMALHRDNVVAYPDAVPSDGTTGGHSLRVQLKPGVVLRHGVYQAREPVRQGLAYRGSLWMKTESFSGRVTFALEADETGGRIYDEAPIPRIAEGWAEYTFTLTPNASDPLARFAILLDGQGTVWIDQASLVPADAVDGVRADVFEKIKQVRPAFIRWPGGNVAQDYHWRWGVGPRDARPTWINLSWQNEFEPSDFGTAEFIRLARNAGAEPSITVNVEGRGATAQEAAAWVEYCNGPATSTYGAMRARDGHPEEYRVTYWEIGNEIWGDWVRGHSDAETYARNLTRYAAAMRSVDPSIKIIAVGDNDMTWNRTVLERAGERFDYLAIHHYYGRRDMQGDVEKLLARPLHYEQFYDEVAEFLRQLPPDRRPKLAINEWGLDLPESQQYSIVAALYGARLMNVFERKSDLVAMSAVSDLVNGWPGGIIQASRHGVFVTPIYLVNSLYASRLGTERLRLKLDDSSRSPIDAVASRSADGRSIYIKAVNTDLDDAATARVRVSGARVSSTAVVERVVADSLTAVNGFGTPEAVKVTRDTIPAGSSFSLQLPRHSIAIVTLAIAN
jgi:alpha-L-arabinofuranosidase